MELIDKANILSDFYGWRDDEEWLGFFDDNYDGIFLAHLVASGDVLELNADGERKIADAYAALLDEWGVDDVEYASLTDLIAGQPNEENA